MSKICDGKKLYRLGRDTPTYEVRGMHVFNPAVGPQPIFEVCGRFLFEYMTACQPVYRIADDNRVYPINDSTRPTYELR